MNYYSRIAVPVLLISCLFTTQAYAPPPDILWYEVYGGTEEDYGRAVCQADGGYMVAAYGSSFGAGGDDVYVMKINEDGDTLWFKTYGGVANERAFSIKPTSDNHYIISGFTSSQGSGGSDVWLLKVDENGDTAWTSYFGNLTWDAAYCANETSDNGFIVAGMSTIYGYGDQLFLVKTDANGDSIWAKAYGGTDQDYGHWVKQTTDGGYIVVGRTYSYGPGLCNGWLLKTDANGDTMWTRLYGGNGEDLLYTVLPLSDGSYILVGGTDSWGAGLGDVYVVRAGADGDTLWMNWYGGANADQGQHAIITHDGNIAIVGYTYSYAVGESDVYLLKIDLNGDTLWTTTVGGIYHDFGYYLDQTPDSGYIIAGRTRSWGAGQSDVYLIKTGTDLGAAENEGRDISTNPTVFPNPFSTSANISFGVDSRQYSVGSMRIYDVAGRCVKSFDPLPYAQSPMQITWDGTDDVKNMLPNGVYLLRLTAGEHSETKKLLLIR
ncbi:hypothetical protein AMJ87_03340 [candidate division WOR_3 bacterium SM23_60]|uniref:Secretion system C-terminal sorting domain-containing protein n=1 Tax=candidate division WOR_3 bacterium SM23_60 TaxID=1703780 RepID=A0A0S8GMP0_UNCW3|nr:MAG: hypothetical protein AMJ87_03340 [candidate division WOR_3 bacterium SM23_60]